MLRFRTGVVCLALLLAALPGAVLAQSQATTGVIEGIISDEAGAPLPGATVAIRNTATNFEKTTTSGPDGRFRGVALPLGPYRVTVSLQGFTTLVREGLELSVGQTMNLTGLVLKVTQRTESVTVTAAAPVVETTRTEGAVQIDNASIQGLPNNGRNYLDFTKLTPGVSVVQGPDGDELTVNGQKGINNNVSVDGADYNNPFFGEQRGGQRPAFTFNLDAVKELVVVSDGAAAEFGRANAGFINVVTKSGTNEIRGSAHGYFKSDSLSSAAVKADGSSADKFDSNQQQYGFTLGGPFVKDKVFFFTAFDYQRGRSTKQTDPNRIDPRLVAILRVGRGAERERPDRPDERRAGLPREARLAGERAASHLPEVQLHVVRAGERDVRRRSLGAQLERDRGRQFERGKRFGSLHVLERAPQRVPVPVGARGPAAPVRGAPGPGWRAPVPGHGRRLRCRLPVRHALLHPRRLPRHAPAAQREPHVPLGQPHVQGRRRVQPDERGADVPRLRKRPDHLRQRGRVSRLHEGPHPDTARRALHSARAGRGPHDRPGRYPEHRPARARRLRSGQVAAVAEPDDQPRPALGGPDRARSDHAARPGVLRGLHREDLAGPGLPVRRQDPVRLLDVAASTRDLVRPGKRRQDGAPRKRRHLRRPRSRAEPRVHALDERHPRVRRVRTTAGLSEHHSGFLASRRRPTIRASTCSARTSKTRARIRPAWPSSTRS